ncbi:nitroreductase family protein [Pseudonocardia xinjiangensis]|uniref:nitroreductase family protein n=1 Tax=Pseudonocardia xinjiangensis TaxID=75289 RepID=UPI003D8E60F3
MTEFDLSCIDEILSTTRAVRKRLDLDRDVPDDTLLHMIDLAEQAPSGSNQSSRRWMIVRDQDLKRKIAELYRAAGMTQLTELAATATEADERGERVVRSAIHLAENLERVPVLVMATIYGVHDGSGRPSLFDSVIQAAWSFCLAARARGIGTAWTTFHLQRAAQVARLLGIPDGVTQVVLFPVAYSTGGSFRRAPRRPAAEVTYVDHWGFTDRRISPAERAHPGEGRGVSLDLDIDATPEQLWPLVTDITLPGRFSGEAVTATWDEGQRPGLGSTFHGSNATRDSGHPTINVLFAGPTGEMAWTTPCHVVRWEPGRAFVYNVGLTAEKPWAQWRFTLSPLAGTGTRVSHSMVMCTEGSGTSAATTQYPDQAAEIIVGRFLTIRDNLRRTLEGIKQLAEANR